MYNFFVNSNQIQEKIIRIIDDDAKHIHSVLRMKKGENIYVCDKDSKVKYLTSLEEIKKEEVICKIIKEVESTEPKIEISLFQGLPKSDKMEYIIQKSVELGIYDITPVDMKNCIAKIKDENKKIDKWQAISESAAKQSKRNIIPKINRLIDVKELKERIKDFDIVIIAYEDEEKTSIKKVISENKNATKIAIIVGPEGGIEKSEVEMLSSAGGKLASLGKRILRTETAPITMLSILIYEYDL